MVRKKTEPFVFDHPLVYWICRGMSAHRRRLEPVTIGRFIRFAGLDVADG